MNEKTKTIIIKPDGANYSGHQLVIIPTDTKFQPTDELIKSILGLLQKEYPNCEIVSEKYNSVTFVDQGQNFEIVSCNHCNKELSVGFWQEKMNDSYDKTNFNDLSFKTNCCGKMSNLNDLIYDGDCGFASYSVYVEDAEYDIDFVNELKLKLSNILTFKFKIFWRRV